MATIEDMIVLLTFVTLQGVILFFLIWLLRKRQVWPLIRLAISGHGSLVQKFRADNGVECAYSPKPIEKVCWLTKNKDGKLKKYSTTIEGVKHTIAGTSIPLHLCPFNTNTNISLLNEKDKELTAKETNELLNYSYLEGIIDARKLLQKPLGMNIDWKMLMILGVFAIIAVIMWPQISQALGG